MLLKKADDKSRRVALLEDLQRASSLDAKQKKWLREEVWNLRKGIRGEVDSAFYLDQYFKDGQNHVVLHDLRFELEGDVAQIDHLIINRLGFMFLLETKNYAGNVAINSHGEFTIDYDGDAFGVPSPIEQSRRHERVLLRLLDRLEITNRIGSALECHHVVLFNPRSIIKRPPAVEFDSTNVIKADQFPDWHTKFADKTVGFGTVFKGMANVRSLDTVKEWGEKLIRQHRPVNQLALPEFMQPRAAAPVPTASPAVINSTTPKPVPKSPGEKRLLCLHCQSKISYAEGKFCWNNEARFRGGQYCRAHQALF